MSYRDKKVEFLKLRGNNTNIALVVPPFRASDEALSQIQNAPTSVNRPPLQ
jgi:hypothetical protein